MKLVGFHYNHSPLDPTHRRSPSFVNRVALIDGYLRDAGLRLFVHRPQHIVEAVDAVSGWLFEGRSFVPTTASIPRTNGNWTHRTRRLLREGMGYDRFVAWARERGIGIYVPHAFSELLGNKLETYKLVRSFHETLHPHCELYAGTVRQLESFVDAGRITFLKPRTGSKGDRIVTVRREDAGLSVTHYEGGIRRRRPVASLREADEVVRALVAAERMYVIQHGVETLRYDGSTFDIRVTMLNDGAAWSWLHEVRRSPEGSDVSNVYQGGETLVTEEFLFEVLGAEGANEILYQLRNESFGLAAYLDRLHPGEILEVAFDFVVDAASRLRLLEINTKPGLAGIGADVSLFDKRPEHEPGFERWVYPHTRALASFLARKARSDDQRR